MTEREGDRRHVMFAADTVAAPAAASADCPETQDELPVASFTASDSTFLTDPELVSSVLRSRPSTTTVDSGAGTSGMGSAIEVPNPLSRSPSGVPMLRRSGTSLAADGAAFAAIDMPPLSRQASLLGDEEDIVVDPSSGSGSSRSSGNIAATPPPADARANTACFGRMRPSIGIALSVLCFVAAVCIFSAWLPEAVHHRARLALHKAMPQQYIFEPRHDIVLIFKQDSSMLADLHTVCGKTHAGAAQPVQRHAVSPTCNLAKACSHVFGSVIHGIAGRFTGSELQLLESCLPNQLHYMEADLPVRHMMEASPPPPATLGAALAARDFSANVLLPISTGSNATGANATSGTVTSGVDQQLVPDSPPVPSVSGAGVVGQHNQILQTFQWNLDRVCKRSLPLDHMYTYGSEMAVGMGENVTIYIVDSGLQTGLSEFKGAGTASRASSGWNAIDSDGNSADCFGHGSALASIAAGTAFGVAKAANVVGVRVLDCNGQGSVSNAVAGLDWVAGHLQSPAVVVLSLGLSDDATSHALDQAVSSLIMHSGVSVIAAAGNGRISACSIVPANVAAAITVAATNLSTKFDAITHASDSESLYRFSNYGSCVDISCPGVEIPFACSQLGLTCKTKGNLTYSVATGTSFAAPHVAGVAAIFLGENPTSTPSQVKTAILTSGTQGKLMHSSFPLRGTPDLVLYSQGVLQGPSVADSDAVDSSATGQG